MKRKYEGIIVLNTQGKEDGVDEMISGISKKMEGEGATLEQIDKVGKKEFAYNARHLSHGYYVNIQFDAEPANLPKIRDFLKRDEDVHLQYFQKK
ncbi:MAG: 30S ribosomal protein S6 [Verrucomicrobia bacterium]|nr:30S ribosomal protein S6 [Verrucomicrobiota bacterium]